MYAPRQIPPNKKPVTRNDAIIDAVSRYVTCWPRYDNATWPSQMIKLLHGTYKTTHPKTIEKASWYTIQQLDGDFPPSMGKIIKTMTTYIGSGKANTPKIQQCDKCNAGLIRVSFWTIKANKKTQVEVNCACTCDYGKKRESSLKLVCVNDFIALNQKKPNRYIANRFKTWCKDHGVWVQEKTYNTDQNIEQTKDITLSKSKDIPPILYNELGLTKEELQRRMQLRQSFSNRQDKQEKLKNVGKGVNTAIIEIAKKMNVPIPFNYKE